MASGNGSVDHNYYPKSFHARHAARLSQQAQEQQQRDIDSDPGRSSPKTHLTPVRLPSFSTDAAVDAHRSGPASTDAARREDDSPDPHDYYRQFKDPFTGRDPFPSDVHPASRAPRPNGDGDGMTTTVRRPDGPVRQHHGSTGTAQKPLPHARNGARLSTRTGAPPQHSSPLGAPKSRPNASSQAQVPPRSRQSSLQDLVNRFNGNTDETLPVPSRPRQPSTDRGNPTARPPRTSRSRQHGKAGQGPAVADGAPQQARSAETTPKKTRRRKNSQEDRGGSSPSSERTPRSERSRTTSVDQTSWASQSMTSLHLSQTEPARQPLFGEVVSPTSGRPDLGFGIPRPRRRGSEGSAHPPTPAPLRSSRSELDVPPSPTTWYLGQPPTLNGGGGARDGQASERPRPHRRAKSEFAAIPADVSGLGLRPSGHPSSNTSPRSSSTVTTKRDSQSRIPLSTRRGSTPSDSAVSPPSTRSNSALENATSSGRSSRTRRPSAIPKLSLKSAGPEETGSPSPRGNNRSKHHDPAQRRGTSPSLKAYISAPLPKKSPPLRSSRPRQPVSTATTSSSRAKVAERYGPQQQGRGASRSRQSGGEPKPKAKNFPELGAVDFAARRERIQRAFTISMREREKKDESDAEKRRATRERRAKERATRSLDDTSRDGHQGESGKEGAGDADGGLNHAGEERPDDARDPGGLDPERRLTLETQLSPKTSFEQDDQQSNDSPTLGVPGAFPTSDDQNLRVKRPTGDRTPTSAVTPIEAEPQVDDPVHSDTHSPQRHRDILSQVMQMRESSPESAAGTHFTEDSASERDEKESIQIMLGETPVESRPAEKPTNYGSFRRTPRTPLGDVTSRWSLDSYASQAWARQSTDRVRESLLNRTDETAASSESTRATSFGRDSQQWSDTEGIAARSGHTTLDSEAYSTINRVLEHYHHDPGLVSPEMFRDFQQQMLTKSHELARQGGWDPKRVTQLYLEELRRGKTTPAHPEPVPQINVSHENERMDQADNAVEDKTQRNEAESKPARTLSRSKSASEGLAIRTNQVYELSSQDATVATPGLEVPGEEEPINRPSLQFAADWTDASPSIVDWIHPQAADTPTEDVEQDYRPTPPPKDWTAERETPERGGSVTPRMPSHPRQDAADLQPAGDGLGLILKGDPSRERFSQPPPPLPDHSPPPPPSSTTTHDRVSNDAHPAAQSHSPPSPSVYSKHPPSTIFPSVFPEGVAGGVRPRIPAVPAFRYGETPSTGQRARSPSKSQSPDHGDHHPGQLVDTPGKEPQHADQRRLTKRKHIIRELLDTEKQFHGDMKVTEEIYKGTANACSAVSPEDVKILFGNIDQIVTFSLSFFDALRQAGSSVYVVRKITALAGSKRTSVSTSNSGGTGEESKAESGVDLNDDEKDRKTFVGEAFGQHMAQLEKVFSEYLKNLEAANKRLLKLQTHPGVALWLSECRSHAEDLTDSWSLDSLIVKPMQRILKYPLLLQALSEVTPEDHPDFTALDVALWEMKAVAVRIEDMMKRVSLVEQAVGRKRKESDVRAGISKAFGRRTEKLKQQVGLSEMFDDQDFNKVAEKWDSHVIQLQFAMADVEKYLIEAQVFVDRFLEYVVAIESYIDVGRSTYPELESKWRKFGMAMRELSAVALTEHKASIQKSVIGPMKTLVKVYDAPQKIIQKRNKRIMDYARYKGVKDRGDKPDKRTQEQGEQFMALNETLKDELPKLYALTGKLAEACLASFIELQARWNTTWQEKLKAILDECQVPRNVADILSHFSGDFAFTEAQANSLGICNGSILADSVNFLTHPTSLEETGSRRPPRRARTRSVTSSNSPSLPAPDFGDRNSGSFMPLGDGMPTLQSNAHYGMPPFSVGRTRASSNVSSHGPVTPDMSSNARSFYMTPATSTNPSNLARPSTSTGRSIDYPSIRRPSTDSPAHTRPASGATYQSGNLDPRAPSPSRPFSGMFSSAMPMADSPRSSPHVSRPTSPRPMPEKASVLFTAASIEEFNIDRSRTEAGYPYLTYVKGEIFDIIGEKGELWLAKNQDDRTQTVGWLWCRHFAQLTGF
ncbi:MAG: hypothetical protein M1832_005659 [Thelocarpon impressellum]|nr:MAG: hypothetical protein M1832_005659 [Thelocarpon impressellum]